MEKEDILFQKRVMDLAHKAYRNNMFTFSTFLSAAEQDMLLSMEKELSFVKLTLWGGNEQCERKTARFGDGKELGYEEEFPIVCLYIQPLIDKFADALTHRDFLGALMNLSIERNTIGDIFIQDKSAYVYCHEKIAPYIMENLDQIKHTHIKCSIADEMGNLIVCEPVRREIIVSSRRIDGIISKLYNMSRTQSINLFREKKVFVNGRIQENNSYTVKAGDNITVRGFGKFRFLEEVYQTKKDKLCLAVASYES